MRRAGTFEFTAVDPATGIVKEWCGDLHESKIVVREKYTRKEYGHLQFVQLVELSKLNSVGLLRSRMEALRRSLRTMAKAVAL